MLGIIRIDRLLNISFTISCLLGVIYGTLWLITGSDDFRPGVLVLWNLGNFVICGLVVAFMLLLEITSPSLLYGGLFFLL